MLLSRLGISVSGSPLMLTGRVHVKDTQLLGTDDMADDNEHEKYRYEITALRGNVTEYYEFDEKKSCADVGKVWLSDVEQRWGAVMADRLRGSVEVRPLWDKTQSSRSERSPTTALPPEEKE